MREAVEDCPSCEQFMAVFFSQKGPVLLWCFHTFFFIKKGVSLECKLSKLQSFCEVGCLMHVQLIRLFWMKESEVGKALAAT